MKMLRVVLIAYTAGMLAIHLSSWKLLEVWDGPADSWAKRRFPAQTALRVEGVYWLLVLASWPLWPSAGWKALVVVFAGIHLGVWMAGELQAARSGTALIPPRKSHRFIVAFDLVEAGALAAIGWIVIARTLGAG